MELDVIGQKLAERKEQLQQTAGGRGRRVEGT